MSPRALFTHMFSRPLYLVTPLVFAVFTLAACWDTDTAEYSGERCPDPDNNGVKCCPEGKESCDFSEYVYSEVMEGESLDTYSGCILLTPGEKSSSRRGMIDEGIKRCPVGFTCSHQTDETRHIFSCVECPEDQLLCGYDCVNPDNNSDHCGGCGKKCEEGEICRYGSCVFNCPAGQSPCKNAKDETLCVDTTYDPLHCGGCDSPCAFPDRCISGKCTPPECSAPFIRCGEECIDPNTNNQFCGAKEDCVAPNTGESCKDGKLCSNGKCSDSCDDELVLCQDTQGESKCVDPKTDPEYCGVDNNCAKGFKCADTHKCEDSRCMPDCPDGHIFCEERCVNPQEDFYYCGAANCSDDKACKTGESCKNGRCKIYENVLCNPPNINCDNTCINPKNDNKYCGAKGNCKGINKGEDCGDRECIDGNCGPKNCAGEHSNECRHQEHCTNGHCCHKTETYCGGKCRNLPFDDEYCTNSNSCSNYQNCTEKNETCTYGHCCPKGHVLCGGKCIDPQTNPEFCGAKLDCTGASNRGQNCGESLVCVLGRCE